MLHPVIMAGGSGSRLWPLSRQLKPKQFLPLMGHSSMLQATLSRLEGLRCAAPLLICNEEHRFLAAEQLRQGNALSAQILLEPAGRNTAPAVALAALALLQQEDDPVMLVLAADHLIRDTRAFHDSIQAALPQAEAGKLLTFGIVPTHPETGYGYIERGPMLPGAEAAYQVARFVEKPDLATAQDYVASRHFFWNSGMFMFRARHYLEELNTYRPDIYQSCERAMAGRAEDMDFIRVDAQAFAACPAESIDYAVMENTADAAMVPLDAGWSDIGSWSALWEASERDADGNSLQGDVLALHTSDTLVRAEYRLVTTLGLNQLMVVETKDAVLVAHKDHVQDVKALVDQLKASERSEILNHREVYRPWGCYDSIDTGTRYQVKRITVKPGARLSTQMHHHRAEHWIVVRGTAKVVNGDNTYLLTENESTYIPVGQVHALENPGVTELEIIEVQSGSYLGEDDIVRFDDRYGRA